MQTSAPKPPVTDRMKATGSVRDELHVCVAPNSVAQASLRSSMSTATIVDAPASAEPAIAASPTPPQPNTATVLPRVTLPVLSAAPRPAITPQPSRPAAVAGLLGCGVMAGLGAAINTAGVTRGQSVAVFGCGGVGDAAIAGAAEHLSLIHI